ncbi:MAG: phosphoribosylaminoimidazolesuccinocarboxamide synthase [Salinibacterium sp.]|nr:phosphoribosylaminoimidazolesuccinocarboxamide synthase [Salinibacterium sp.]
MANAASSTCWDSSGAVFTTNLNLLGRREGKVRDVYRLPGEKGGLPDRLAIIATDRLSAFDVVLPTPHAGKGKLLTGIAAFWFRWLEARGLGPTHLLSTDVDEIPESAFAGSSTTREALRGRVTIARSCRVLPIECVVRGYLEGSGWKDYQRTGTVCGVSLPKGLAQGDRLPEPVFTPATKAEMGEHDENISFERACAIVGEDVMRRARERSVAIYDAAVAYALERGVILADTKFEFGFEDSGDDVLMLIDEALTPDSSRYWPAEAWKPGGPQASYDKQFVREYLQKLVDEGRWNKAAPGPELPEQIVAGTLNRYREACDVLTG